MKKEKDFYQVSLKLLLKNSEGKILALKAVHNGSYAGFYDLPGGRIDTDEFKTDFSNIIAREVVEEIGNVEFQIQQNPVAVGRHLIPASMTSSGKDIHVLYLFFEAHYGGGELKISSEHAGYQWLDLAKIDPAEYFTSGILEGIRMYIGK
jgi:8-oxo-dGTP pyrophosphatase MutT (NUDIX family)